MVQENNSENVCGAFLHRFIFILGVLFMQYKTVSEYGEDSFIEKKSKFIGYCKNVETEDEAKEFINIIKKKHQDAGHNVSAYRVRENNTERFSDDGEPQGTAGIPVLDVLKKTDTINAVIVVTRYFGGTMLGAGGLVRAYSHAASLAFKSAKPTEMKLCKKLMLKFDYSYYGIIPDMISSKNGVVDEVMFEDLISLDFHALPEDLEVILDNYAEITKGKGIFIEKSENFYPFSK